MLSTTEAKSKCAPIEVKADFTADFHKNSEQKTLEYPMIFEEGKFVRCLLTHGIWPLDFDIHLPTCENLEFLEINSNSSLAYLLEYKPFGTALKQLKISKCPGLVLHLHLMELTSLESLEFNSCFFLSCSIQDYFPLTLKKLKIVNCPNSELVLKVLMEQKGLSIESLLIEGCSSLFSFPMDKLPATIRHLKIENCVNLTSFSESLKIEKDHSVIFGVEDDSNLQNLALFSTLNLRELEIWDCPNLKLLPEGLFNLKNLELLSLSNCFSLVCFPEEGLPSTSLKSLLIFSCYCLKSLPNYLDEFRSLHTLSLFVCPRLVSFPGGCLPPDLETIYVADCERLIQVCKWRLHGLKHLKRKIIIWGCPRTKNFVYEDEDNFDIAIH
ncbi:hypothetical protein Pint_23890 [Pistacia integerrima]|uniref:Uncharacterized protein n=1 Tax=Pistacia integerrima TaxID=434235 RepID=A0ACC0YLV8_9ROSI|nr:hypothetical protein Pint_23890 [Pistacia integerrima]